MTGIKWVIEKLQGEEDRVEALWKHFGIFLSEDQHEEQRSNPPSLPRPRLTERQHCLDHVRVPQRAQGIWLGSPWGLRITVFGSRPLALSWALGMACDGLRPRCNVSIKLPPRSPRPGVPWEILGGEGQPGGLDDEATASKPGLPSSLMARRKKGQKKLTG